MNSIALRNAPATVRPASWTWLGSLQRFAASVVRSIRVQRQRRMLEQMPDFLLKDIGIERSEIESVISAIVNGQPDGSRVSRDGTNGRRER